MAHVLGTVKLDPMACSKDGGDDAVVLEGEWGYDEKGGASARTPKGVEYPGRP